MSSYSRLTRELRYQISGLLKADMSYCEIAAIVGVDKSTISREIARNSISGVYSPDKAHKKMVERISVRTKPKRFSFYCWLNVCRKLKQGWSPEQIRGRFKRDNVTVPSVEWIYVFIRTNKATGGKLYTYLRHQKPYKQRGKPSRKFVIQDRKSIHQRSCIVEKRVRLGDWEADLIIGVKYAGAAATLVDRTSRKLLMSPTYTGKKAKGVTNAINRLLKDEPVKTVTFDNGSEFTDHMKIAESNECGTYFCDPYTSQQRGTNENTNGLIRQYLPKTRDLTNLTQTECDQITNKLNNRPRKCLNWQTPNEVALTT